MNGNNTVSLGWGVLVVAAAALLAAGAGAAYLLLPSSSDLPTGDGAAGVALPASLPAPSTAAAPASEPAADVVVTINADAGSRAGIRLVSVDTGTAAGGLRLPGLVEPNAYRKVTVTPLVGGRITRVLVELGQQVRAGQTMAQVFSPELADAHSRYTSARAGLEAHDRELQRTQKLVEIGAASKQELERIHAEHTAQIAAVASARSRLELFGVPVAALDAPGTNMVASANVPAPIAGVVTERLANVGLNVDTSTTLFTVVNLSTVWVVADLFEKDFARVRVGAPARVTTPAYPDRVIQGRVSYIDPQVESNTRTAKVRVEVANAAGELRLGMFAEVEILGGAAGPVAVVPRGAVQTVGNRHVVYLANANQPGRYIEREVRLGARAGDRVEILSGVQSGDVVVGEGSFFVRAELERLGLAASVAAPSPPKPAAVQEAKVMVGEQGFEPAKLTLQAGTPARITFVRTSDKTCGTEVVFPSLSVKRALPLNAPVVIELTPAKSGDIAFACGMNMLKGVVMVTPD